MWTALASEGGCGQAVYSALEGFDLVVFGDGDQIALAAFDHGLQGVDGGFEFLDLSS